MWIFAYTNGTANRNFYSSAEFDKRVVAALTEQDKSKRNAIAKDMQQIHADDAGWVMLYYPGIHQAMARCISGWVWHPDDWPRFHDLRCDS